MRIVRKMPWRALGAGLALVTSLTEAAPPKEAREELSAPRQLPPTLSCEGAGAAVSLSWKYDVEDPDGPGEFTLQFTDKKLEEKVEVTSFTPVFDPLSDLVRYRTGWSSKDFKTTLRLHERDGKTLGDYESRAAVANDLLCDNNLPIRSALVVFPEVEWTSVTTAIALIDGVRFKRDDAATKDKNVTLLIRFGTKVDTTKLKKKLEEVKSVTTVTLRRVDGSLVPTAKPTPPSTDRRGG